MKRTFDLIFAIPGALILSPFLLAAALFVKMDSPGPALFRQVRVGKDGRLFQLAKFRTMHVDAEKMGPQITVGRDPRITRVGAILRKTKIDEFPQLINVIRGEMSLVGPRPEVPKYVDLYSKEQRQVLSLMPGITDPASIQYRHESEVLEASDDPLKTYVEEIMPDKIQINLEYASESNVITDFIIVIKTLTALFS